MGERSGAPSGFSPASIVISKPPVAVQLPQPDVSANRDAPQVLIAPPKRRQRKVGLAVAKPKAFKIASRQGPCFLRRDISWKNYRHAISPSPAILLGGPVDYDMYKNFRSQLDRSKKEGLVVTELSTLGGDPEVARMMGEDIRFHSENSQKARFVFLGKAAIYSIKGPPS